MDLCRARPTEGGMIAVLETLTLARVQHCSRSIRLRLVGKLARRIGSKLHVELSKSVQTAVFWCAVPHPKL